MKDLLKSRKQWADSIRKMPITLFLDFDGTLTPIKPRPDLVRLAPDYRRTLSKLAKLNNVKIVVISGRALTDVKNLVRVPGIIYAGNHGLEIKGPGINYLHRGALKAKTSLKNISNDLRKAYRGHPGVLVENKIFTVSVHYRQVPQRNIKNAQKILLQTLKASPDRKKVILTSGKRVWEIRPAIDWNKGRAARWLYQRLSRLHGKKMLPVCIGDDRTDEDIFKALGRSGISVKVAVRPSTASSHAGYHVRSSKEVFSFLRNLYRLKTADRKAASALNDRSKALA